MNGFREKASRTDERTDGRTNATPKVSNDQLVERPKSSRNPDFEPFEAKNDLFLTIFGQNQANLRMARNQKFQLQLY